MADFRRCRILYPATRVRYYKQDLVKRGMTQLGEAVARYQKILEGDPYRDLAWAEQLQEQMSARRLVVAGRPICPFLRPHFLSERQYAGLAKGAEALFSAIDRMKQLALATPALLSRMHLLPAEKMLAAVDPGYPSLAVTSLLDTRLHNGSMHFVEYNADTPTGLAYAEGLAELFYDCPPMKELRKRYKLKRAATLRPLLHALLKAYKDFGKKNRPRIAILEFRQTTQTVDAGEFILLRDYFRKPGYETEVVYPDQLEYRGGVLRQGDFVIDLVYRRVKVQEFLLRFDLANPLVRAYREGKVCVVNSFRSELAHKKALFDLLTDETITAKFPAAERRAIRDFIPWTRVVAPRDVNYKGKTVDLIKFIQENRPNLLLRPNDGGAELHTYHGWELDDAAWERALRIALRTPYVVQERVEAVRSEFPIYRYGQLEIRELQIDVHPHAYLGKVEGCSGWLSTPGSAGFSTLAGPTPIFILSSK